MVFELTTECRLFGAAYEFVRFYSVPKIVQDYPVRNDGLFRSTRNSNIAAKSVHRRVAF